MTGAIGPKVESIPLASIRDAGAQMREEMHPETVLEYAAAMIDGAIFPPIIVYHDGTDYYLGDGFHRYEAAKKAERKTISADVRRGTARDAVLCGVGANATHGLRRTQADKRRAVVRLLQDPEWSRWSDRKIAEAARVDGKTVAKVHALALAQAIIDVAGLEVVVVPIDKAGAPRVKDPKAAERQRRHRNRNGADRDVTVDVTPQTVPPLLALTDRGDP